MQFIDLKAQQSLIREDIEQRIARLLDHGQYILGPEVREMEEQLAGYVEVAHCISCSSGTDALQLALMALGIGPGDEVITTPFSFIATAEIIGLLGATPVFVDIEPDTFNIDAKLIEAAISNRTRAIMPVSLFGQCADMDTINDIAARHGLPVIEDAAQSFGAEYKGRKSCSLSNIGCTSFFPAKPLGCYGDGGACFTNDDELALRMREIRNHGQDRQYHHPRLGVNGRMDTLQCAVIQAKMGLFPDEAEARSRLGARYAEMLAGANCAPPAIAPYNKSVYAQYTLMADDREAVRAALKEKDIPSAVYYPITLNRQPALVGISRTPAPLNFAETAQDRVFSIPMHPYLREDDMQTICTLIRNTVGPA